MGTAGFLRRDRVNLASDVGDDAAPAVLKMRPRCVAISPSMIRPQALSRAKYRLAIASDRLYRLFTVRRDFDLGGFGGKVFTKAAARSSQSRKVRSSRGGGSTKT